MDTLALPHPESSQDNRDLELTPRVLNTIFKWKWLILTCFLGVVLPVIVITLLKSPQYEVTTKILVKSSRAEITLSPSSQQDRNVVTSSITPAVINSEIQLLKSLELIQQAVEKSGYPLLPDGQNGTAALKERALQSIQTRMKISRVPDSNVIGVTLEDSDSHWAARLLNTLASLYLEKHVTVHRGGDNAAEFFEKQAILFKAKFEAASDALQKFQDKHHIIDLRDEISLNLQKLSNLQATLNSVQVEIEGTEKEIPALEQQVKQQPNEVSKQKTMVVNPEATSLTVKIVELEKQRNELRQRYTPKSRFVVDKENEIAALRKQLEEIQQHVVGDTVIAQNQLKESLNQQIITKKILLDSLKAKKRAMIQEIAPYEARLNLLNDAGFEAGKLRKEFDTSRENYLSYTKKAEETRMSTAMDEEKLINVGIIQKAVAPVLPSPRGLMVAAALASVSGLALGVAIAFALEFFNLTIKHEDDVERFLGVPVLATIRHF